MWVRNTCAEDKDQPVTISFDEVILAFFSFVKFGWNILLIFFFSEILSTDGLAANSNDQGQDSDEDSEDEEAESYPALRDALAQLGIPEYVDLFESEEMDMETFVSWSTNEILVLYNQWDTYMFAWNDSRFNLTLSLECFLTECHKTWTKVI